MALENTANADSMNLVQFRFERGDSVVGTDGPLGRVEQIVVAPDSGELRSLIVRENDSVREVELPANLIVRTLDHEVEVSIGRDDLTAHPELATPYDPSHYIPVFEGTRMPDSQAGIVSAQTDHPVVTEVEPEAAELVSARAELAPEGEIEAIPMDGQMAHVADAPQAPASAPAAEDRVVEPPRVVPAAETPPAEEMEAAPMVPPGEDLMALESPPTPVDRQLPPAGETSDSDVVAAEVTAIEELTESDIGGEDMELTEQIVPFFVTEDELEPLGGIPWGALLAVVAMTAAGVGGVALWRARARMRCAAATRGSGLPLRLGRWQMPREVNRMARDAGDTLQDALQSVREQAEQMMARMRMR